MSEKCKGITGAFPQRNYSPIQSINPNSAFNYNNILNSVQIYNDMNYAANVMTGIETRWFRAVPELGSKDVFFLEYTLSSVDPDPLCIKVVVPNGQFPDAKSNYDLMGLEYEIPLEVQMDFRYWVENAGEGTMPQKGDIVYIPLPNKLYEVNSSSEVRGFMEQITGYKCNLVKYVPSASRTFLADEETGMTLEDTLSKYTMGVESVFGEEIKDEIEKLTSPQQLSPNLNTKRDDYKKLTKGVKTTIEDIFAANTIFANSYYDFSDVKSDIAIEYNYKDSFSIDSEKGISAWVNLKKNGRSFDVISINKLTPNRYKIKAKTLQNIPLGSYVSINKSESLYINAKIVDLEDGFYIIEISDYFREKMEKLKLNWFEIKGYKININGTTNIISSELFSLDIINRKIVMITLNGNIYEYCLEKTLKDKEWYGLVVNFSNKLNKLGLNIWTSNQMYNLSDNVPQLELLGMDSWDVNRFESGEFTYHVKTSNTNLTNIRVFDMIIVEAKNQIDELLSVYTKHSDKYIIIDNADIITNMSYITENR